MSDYTVELYQPVIEVQLAAEQGPAGATGPSGVATPAYTFYFGDATPALITTLPAGTRIFALELAINAAFDGIGAAVTVGTLADNDALLRSDQVNPGLAAIYESSPNLVLGEDTAIYLFISPGSGASQGNGSVSIQRQ